MIKLNIFNILLIFMLIFDIIFIISIFGLLLLFSITSCFLGMSVILNLMPCAVILTT